MSVRRAGVAVCLAALVAIASASAVAPGEAAKKPPPSQAAVAKQLAARVVSARTPAARHRALMAVMRALHMRVVSPRGRVLVRGGRDLPSTIVLYEFELRALAAGMARGAQRTLAEAAESLEAAGVKPVSAEELGLAMRSGVRAAVARPRSRSSLVALLARELGRSAGYDLAAATAAERVRLDPLQSFLLAADLAAGAARQRRLQSLSSPSERAAAAAPCGGAGATAAKEVTPFAKWVTGLISKVGKPVGITIDAIHGPLLALSVRVTAESPELQQTHYGPAGHRANAGQPLRFRVKAEMLDDYGELVINCGPLIGMKFPKKGGIPGITVLWLSDLEKHGTLAYEPADKKTGRDGIATLVFTPKDERFVGFGLEKSERGTTTGIALYQSAFGNVPGSLAQFLTPKQGAMAWEVLLHKPRGFKFEGLELAREFSDPPNWNPSSACTFGPRILLTSGDSCWYERWDEQHSGRVCGDDPYARPWDFQARAQQRVVDAHPGHGGGHDLRHSREWTGSFVPGVPFERAYGNPVFGESAEFDLVLESDGPKARIRSVASPPGTRAYSAVVSLTEDMSCPENG